MAEFSSHFDPQLVELYYQFGRYLLISSSRPGTQPANLQGIWNPQLYPPWDSKYTVNINTEMNYWPAEPTNLAELHQPLFDLIREVSETGSDAARQMYGADGWMLHHNTDIWRITGPVDGLFMVCGRWAARGSRNIFGNTFSTVVTWRSPRCLSHSEGAAASTATRCSANQPMAGGWFVPHVS